MALQYLLQFYWYLATNEVIWLYLMQFYWYLATNEVIWLYLIQFYQYYLATNG